MTLPLEDHRHPETVQHYIRHVVEEKQNPKPTAKALDEHRISILYFLHKMQRLTPMQIKRLVYPTHHKNTVYVALQHLTDRKFIAFHTYSKGRGIGSLERLYYLTQQGFKYLKNCQLSEFAEQTFTYHAQPITLANYEHRKHLVDFWVALECEANNFSSHEIMLFVPEWQRYPDKKQLVINTTIEGEPTTIKPDATFILRKLSNSLEALFFLEIDMETETVISTKHRDLRKRFGNYQQAFISNDFQSIAPNFERFSGARVLFVTTSGQRIAKCLEALELQPHLRDSFLFSTHSEVLSHGVIRARYIKKGCADVVGINSKPITANN